MTTASELVRGECDARFLPVRERFAQSFADESELGAAVAVYVGGERVVDLWGGHLDRKRTKPWQRDTLVNVFSTTKAMAALCLHQLIDEGRLGEDDFVRDHWPEYGCAGKEETRVVDLLAHRAGVPGVRELLPPDALYDWPRMVRTIERETPWWEPGTAHGYHAVTFGWLVGEVVHRVSGRSPGRYFREHVADPLELDFHIGLPHAEHERVGRIYPVEQPNPGSDGIALMNRIMDEPDGIVARTFANPMSILTGPNTTEWKSAEIPSANGHGTARAIAKVYAALAAHGEHEGVRVLSREGVQRLCTERSRGDDRVLGLPTRFGSGVMLSQDVPGGSFGRGGFGHPGAGGSVGWADTEANVAFGYTMNRMGGHILVDPRARALADAVYECL